MPSIINWQMVVPCSRYILKKEKYIFAHCPLPIAHCPLPILPLMAPDPRHALPMDDTGISASAITKTPSGDRVS